MSTRARKERKRAGVQFQHPVKVPSGRKGKPSTGLFYIPRIPNIVLPKITSAK